MTTLEINLLGTFQAAIGTRPLTQFRSDKVRALLIYLVVEAERPHRRETLAGLLWPDFSQKSALSNLRKSIYHLRQALDKVEPGFSDQLLTVTRQTIQINPEKLLVDFNQFQENLDSIKQHRHQHLHNCNQCLKALKKAASLYQGGFTAGFSLADASTFESWLLIQRESSQQETLFALEHLASASEISGDYDQAKYYATQQLMLEPWRENAYRQLMRALALNGRRSEALAQYENCRQTLWDELEVEPAPETQQLFETIKYDELVPQESRTKTQLHHFPTQFTPFIGRKKELAEIVDQLTQDECRLLTLIGQGGIGKTRLTIEAARELAKEGFFKDGIYFVSLAAITDGDSLLMAIANQLDVSIYSRSSLQLMIKSYLADQDVLLVLDNFEQLTAESDLISQLMQETQNLKFLVSSREALNIRAEQRLVISGLSNESAVTLFIQAAQKIWPAYKPKKQDLVEIQEVCRLVGEIPLAVEMAAAWVKTLDVAAIAQQIRSNFEVLKAPHEDLPERHQSMRVVFEESWKLLNRAEQDALAQFSVFKGGFSLYAALENTNATINEVAALLDKSLLAYPGKSRYQLHDLLRQFAKSKLNETSQAAKERLQQDFAKYYLDLLHRSEAYLYGKTPHIGMADIQTEIENILQAWNFAVENNQLALASKVLDSLKMYYRLSGQYREGFNQFSATIESISQMPESIIRNKLFCYLSLSAADFAMLIGEQDFAEQHITTASEISKNENWPDILADIQKTTGDLHYQQSKYIHASSYLQNAINYYESANNKRKLVESYYKLGICFQRSDRWQDTAKILGKALNLAQQLEYNWAVVTCLWALGYLYREKGRRELSLEYHEKSIKMAFDINYLLGVQRAYISCGLIYEDLGNYQKAFECHELSIKYAQEIGHPAGLARAKGSMARVLWLMKRYEEALTIMNETLPLTRELGYKLVLAWQLIVKAEILFSLGRYHEAWPINDEGLKLARQTTLVDRILQSQILRIRLLVALDQSETAINDLKEMLAKAEDAPTIAEVCYQYFQLTKDKTYGELAQTNYLKAYEADPYIRYKNQYDLVSQQLLE